jgi:hypothetical protein
MGNYDGSFFLSTTQREGSGMPNGYAFVIVLILIALVGGLVYCSFEINDLRSRLETAERVNNTTIDQLTSCQQKEATCQADLQDTRQKLEGANAAIEQLRNQTACGPVVPVTPATSIGTTQSSSSTTGDAGNLSRILTILVASLGAGGGGLAYLRRGWGLPSRKDGLISNQPTSTGPRSYYIKVTDGERSQLVKQRRNR